MRLLRQEISSEAAEKPWGRAVGRSHVEALEGAEEQAGVGSRESRRLKPSQPQGGGKLNFLNYFIQEGGEDRQGD